MATGPSRAPGSAVFLDRDGTLIDELGYLASPDALVLFPGAARAVARLNAAGLPVLVVTNQSGIARGLFDEDALRAIHLRLNELLAEHGAHVDAFYHCPHHPDLGAPEWRKDCACRKPAPGMFLDAARERNLDLGASHAVGDAARDLEAAARAGIGSRLLVRTGKGADTERALTDRGVTVVDDLGAAVDAILAR